MILAYGELMLRLKSPGKERFFQSPLLEATFGGGEANTLAALSAQGLETSLVTVLPEGPLGEAAMGFLRQRNIGTSAIKRIPGRLGIYFLEEGASQRPSQVIYDREGAVINHFPGQNWDWKGLLQGATALHLTGITPGLSALAAETSLDALKAAKSLGILRTLDLNYRKKLWNYGKTAPEIMVPLAQNCEVLLSNEEDLQKSLGLKPIKKYSHEEIGDLIKVMQERFPQVRLLTITLRTSLGADKNLWEALGIDLVTGKYHHSPQYTIDPVVDRVGSGDAFSAGIILGLIKNWELEKMVNYATALSCLKHSVPGDQALITPSEVELLLSGDGSGRVQR